MNRKLLWLVTVLLLASVHHAAAQQLRTKVPRVGFLLDGAEPSFHKEGFLRGMRELGYVDSENIAIEYRWAEGKYERLPVLATELVGLNVDVIVALSTVAARPAKEATKAIPIVFVSGDPIGTGLVDSLARPGGNITGLATVSPELSTKRLEIIKEVVPKASRVAVIWNPGGPSAALAFKEIESAARVMGMKVQSLGLRGPKPLLEAAFNDATKEGAAALLTVGSVLTRDHRTEIVALAEKNRLPAIYDSREFTEVGGLMSYGINITDLFRRAATYVDKILKGAKPADLPVEQPKKFEFVINLKAAKQIGLTIPPNVLVRADKVIK
ncbi:MAG TPA: ABC transporter substrate-binding protein [Pyrinomonadaceae bacterium]